MRRRTASRAWRLVGAVGLVLGLGLVPIGQVAACDCALTELPQAIKEAEVAIVGTLAGGSAPPAAPGMVAEPTQYTWAVERARDPMSAVTLTVAAWPDDGANCGIRFGADERWLILAYQSDNGLETNGCMPNLRLVDAAPDQLDIVDEMVSTSVDPSQQPEAPWSVPVPILVAIGALALGTAVSFVAFRRSGPPGAA